MAVEIFTKQYQNGLVLTVDQAPRFSATAVALSIRSGLLGEPHETSGVTHMLEHLLFKRTANRAPFEIASLMDEFGGEINAFTDVDSLCLYGVVPKDRVGELLSLFAELLLSASFTEEDVRIEREIIRQEILEAEEDPAEMVYEHFSRGFWGDSVYGRAVFGTLSSVDAITWSKLKARLAEIVQGARIVIAVCGNVDANAVAEHTEALFSSVPLGAGVQLAPAPASSGITIIEKNLEQVHLVLGMPWFGAREEQFIAGQLLSATLGGGLASRLFQLIRETQGLAYDISTEVEAYPDCGSLLISSVVERTNLSRLLAGISTVLTQYLVDAPNEAELERSKRQYLAQLTMESDSTTARMWRLLESQHLFGRYVSADELATRVVAVSREQVVAIAQSKLRDGRLSLVGDCSMNDIPDDVAEFCSVF